MSSNSDEPGDWGKQEGVAIGAFRNKGGVGIAAFDIRGREGNRGFRSPTSSPGSLTGMCNVFCLC